MTEFYACDFESLFTETMSIKTMGTWNYLRAPGQDIYLVTIHGPKGTWFGRPELFDWTSINGFNRLSHNASFDVQVYERLKELFPDMPWPDPPEWHCTADLAVYVGAGRALKTAAKHLLGVEISKAYRGTMLNKTPADLTPEQWKQVTDAGIADAVNCWEIWDKYNHRWPEHERRLSLITRQMGWGGLHADLPKLEESKKLLTELLWAAEQKIPWAGEKDAKGKPIPLLSSKMVAEQCRKEGIPAPASMSKEDPEFDLWLALYDERFPWVRAVSEYRRINTVGERVNAMLARMMTNGRFSYGLKYFGAHTGRWSGDGGLNVQNQLKLPLFITKSRTVVRDATEIEKLAKLHTNGEPLGPEIMAAIDTRSLIVSPLGKKFFVPDLTSIEPRCTWWLTDDQKSMKLAANGMSPYEVHARGSMGWTGGELKVENKKVYALAKARILALGYCAGWLKFFGMSKTYGVSPEVFDDTLNPGDREDFESYLQALKNKDQWLHYSAADDVHKLRYANAWKIVNDFRESNLLLSGDPGSRNPKLAKGGMGLWTSLDRGFKMSRGKTYQIELPSGRVMQYRNVSGFGGWTAEVINSTTGQLMRTRFYGGKLTENLVQATARDVFAEAKLRLVDSGYFPVLSVHDELVFEIEDGQPTQPILDLMTQVPSWLPGCPIAAEGVVSPFYCK